MRLSPQLPTLEVTKQQLLLGTFEGKLDDTMYGVVATSDEAMKIKSASTNDGVKDSKVLCDIRHPTFEDPFRHVSIKWRLYDSKSDFVSLDASGIIETTKRERVGYSISHSVAFPELPSFETAHGIERLNMSVCSLYRQKTPTTVECYVRGFFEFRTQNEMLGNLTLQAIASQWSALRADEEARLENAQKLRLELCLVKDVLVCRRSERLSSSVDKTYSRSYKGPRCRSMQCMPQAITIHGHLQGLQSRNLLQVLHEETRVCSSPRPLHNTGEEAHILFRVY